MGVPVAGWAFGTAREGADRTFRQHKGHVTCDSRARPGGRRRHDGAARRYRRFRAPWQPQRPDSYFTTAGQREAAEAVLAQQDRGVAVPLVIVDGGGGIVGTLTSASIFRTATAALRKAVDLEFVDLRL